MSDAEKQLLLDTIHQQLNDAISYNLYTGLAYGHMFMFCSTMIIFLLATTLIVIGPGLTSQAIPMIIKAIDSSLVIGWSPHKVDIVVGTIATITRLNACFPLSSLMLGDVVCAWRAIVLWKYDRRVVTVLSICLLGTLAACIYDLKLALQTQPGNNRERNLPEGKVAAIVVGPMLGTNILSTSLIAWKAWKYRLAVGAQLKKGSPSDRVEKVLALLIESGFAYCLLWIFYLLSAYSVLPGAGAYTVNIVMLYISSMYPAVIIIIVCLQIGHEVYDTRPEHSNGLDLTTVHFPTGEVTVDDSRLTMPSYGGRVSSMSPPPGASKWW
ncbi:hypothetical protein BJV74DRAFT_796576 [Russula compacta]|nr:hypothetical protein BJV74DRAFT_796576 [Russula compacta]